MDLNKISNIYKRNLESFFSNIDVIEIIYNTQFGEDYFQKKEKEKCINNFREIMKNTVFIPYITMEHLENFLVSARKNLGDQYVEENYAEEINLLRQLQIKEKTIIKDYSSLMLDELKQFYPQLNPDEYNQILEQCPNSSFEDNVSLIQNLLSDNENGSFQKVKKIKIEKCIENFKKIVKDKITMETSSYFKHISDIPNGKYYDSILDEMNLGGQFVSQIIGKNTDRNVRYIFLPVLAYQNKEEYLLNALHEVMHISKEIIINKKYISGLLEKKISSNPIESGVFVEDNYIKNLVHHIQWKKYATINNFQNLQEKYDISSGDIALEEVTHHWQVREAMSKILENPTLIALLQMPYDVKGDSKSSSAYEFFDNYTKPFMEFFNKDIQKINTGELSIREFKKKLGKSNFDLFSHTANTYIGDLSNLPEADFLAALVSSTTSSGKLTFTDDIYDLITDMKNHSDKEKEKAEKRKIFLEKTRSIASIDIANIGEQLLTYKKRRIQSQNRQSQCIDDVECR